MAVTKAKKIEQVEQLTKEFQDAKHGIVGTFAKMTVEKDFELRKVVRGAGARYRVVKNTPGRACSQGYLGRGSGEGPRRSYLDRLHQRRPCRAGQGAQ